MFWKPVDIEAPISERQTLQELSLIKLTRPQAQVTPVSILPLALQALEIGNLEL
jgi:hypothetical protein